MRVNRDDAWRIAQGCAASLLIAVALLWVVPVILDPCQPCRDGLRPWWWCLLDGCLIFGLL